MVLPSLFMFIALPLARQSVLRLSYYSVTFPCVVCGHVVSTIVLVTDLPVAWSNSFYFYKTMIYRH